jgi:hypothetical protein
MEIFIYGLTDPRNGQIRYIGKTVNVKKRLWFHIYGSRNFLEDSHKSRWIRQLLAVGLSPGIVVLTTTEKENWEQEERRWIADNKEKLLLTNVSAGGEGVDAPRTEQWRKRISQALKGRTYSPETIERMRLAQLAKRGKFCKNGHEFTPENTKIVHAKKGSWRKCKQCDRERRMKRYREKGLLKGRKKSCKLGHLLEGNNLRISTRTRNGKQIVEHICRECVRIRNRRANKNSRAKALLRVRPVRHKIDSFCKNGHEYRKTASYDQYGYRFCKECVKYYGKRGRKRNLRT